MKESEKIALELVDYLIDRAAGFHILTSVPKRVTKSVVKLDHDNLQIPPEGNFRRRSAANRDSIRSPSFSGSRSPVQSNGRLSSFNSGGIPPFSPPVNKSLNIRNKKIPRSPASKKIKLGAELQL